MNNELIIEHYLSQLDRELQALPTGQRAEIITEIRSHILDATEKDPTKSIQTLLDDLGAPQVVAQKYLQAKGVKGWAPSRARNWLRVFALGVAGLFAFAVISTLFAVWYLSPLVHIDEEKGRVVLLGGLIDVNEATDSVKIGGMKMQGSINGSNINISGTTDEQETSTEEEGENDFKLTLNGATQSEGDRDLTAEKVKTIKIPFNTAKMGVRPAKDAKFHWECRNPLASAPPITVAAGVMTFDLNKVAMAKCEFQVPAGVQTEITGINGALELHKPNNHTDVKITNGKVDIKPDRSKVYDFEVKVQNGIHDNFARSEDRQALKVKVDIINGAVKKE